MRHREATRGHVELSTLNPRDASPVTQIIDGINCESDGTT